MGTMGHVDPPCPLFHKKYFLMMASLCKYLILYLVYILMNFQLKGKINIWKSLFKLEPSKRTRAPVKATPKNIIMRPPQSTTRLPSELQAPWKIQIIGTLEGKKITSSEFMCSSDPHRPCLSFSSFVYSSISTWFFFQTLLVNKTHLGVNMVVSSEKVWQTHYEETKTGRETDEATTKYQMDVKKQNPRQELINILRSNDLGIIDQTYIIIEGRNSLNFIFINHDLTGKNTL